MMPWPAMPAHARWLEAEGDRLVSFSRAAAHPDGGFAWLDEAGHPELERPVELWITCRMTHVFSLAHLMGRPGTAALAEHGLRAIAGRFHDDVNGGWYAAVDQDGPTGRSKTAYPHAFVVLAAASATCAGLAGGRELLDEALDVLLTRFWDEEHGMVVEEWDETFTTLDEYRGVNANMHCVEALLAAADATGDRALLDRVLQIVTRVVHDLGPAHSWRLPEHFDPSWVPLLEFNHDSPADPFRPYGATIGHWLEWARLALHLRAALGSSAPDWLLTDAVSLFQAAITEGWEVDGTDGFVYTVDWSGQPVVRERMHWVAAEGTATAAALFTATGDPAYAAWYATWWDHVAEVFIDPERGSWRHELDAKNQPSAVVWAGKPDTYHAFQATLIPRLPLTPTLAGALRDGLLD
ncbi:N-acylglucosamine 2-epimerase [metagenome]|uniref:N-acylglucosamine 2-epimerase n=1 Tax=metagenome TaxID=256318 RepID=A0A2P2CEW0_9ZZZZ